MEKLRLVTKLEQNLQQKENLAVISRLSNFGRHEALHFLLGRYHLLFSVGIAFYILRHIQYIYSRHPLSRHDAAFYLAPVKTVFLFFFPTRCFRSH